MSFISLLITAVEYRIIAKMNEQQLEAAKLHFEELRYGMKNIEVKSLGLRSFCQRKERMNNGVRLRLWSLKPEWLQYVDKHRVLDKTPNNSEPHTEKQSTYIVSEVSVSDFSSFVQEESSFQSSTSSSDGLATRMENSILNGQCKLVNVFDRATLLFRYYEQLIGEGMTDDELIEADLVYMLNQYLDYKSHTKRFYIRDPRKQLILKCLIRKYCENV